MYKLLTKRIAIACLACLVAQACVDENYDLDDLNTEAVFYLPPIPVGSVDTAWLMENLTKIEIPDDPGTFALEYVIQDIFTEDIIGKFFFEGAGDISLEGKLDLAVAALDNDAGIVMKLNILDSQDNIIGSVAVDDGDALNTIGQDFAMHISGDYLRHMTEARGVRIVFVFTGCSDVNLAQTDYLVLRDLVLKTGGMFLDLDE
ncbi:MAG: hypothetical protein LBI96_06105 [Odoribacteraceae bacterium]|jgi:hypothetical protein|nr:hypothetical protein [Odoribacteraceae bacterium]